MSHRLPDSSTLSLCLLQELVTPPLVRFVSFSRRLVGTRNLWRHPIRVQHPIMSKTFYTGGYDDAR